MTNTKPARPFVVTDTQFDQVMSNMDSVFATITNSNQDDFDKAIEMLKAEIKEANKN